MNKPDNFEIAISFDFGEIHGTEYIGVSVSSEHFGSIMLKSKMEKLNNLDFNDPIFKEILFNEWFAEMAKMKGYVYGSLCSDECPNAERWLNR